MVNESVPTYDNLSKTGRIGEIEAVASFNTIKKAAMEATHFSRVSLEHMAK